jgi:hypothetical protein
MNWPLLVLASLAASASTVHHVLDLQHGDLVAVVEETRATARVSAGSSAHFGLFPVSLGALALQHGLRELTWSLTQGRWHWGTHQQALYPAPPGLAAEAVFGGAVDARDEGGVNDTAWASVVQALATLTGVPAGDLLQNTAKDDETHSYSAVAPLESVCLQHVARWRRLHPIRHSAASPPQLHAARYLSLFVRLTAATEASDGHVQLALTLVLTAVQRVAPGFNVLAQVLGAPLSASVAAETDLVFDPVIFAHTKDGADLQRLAPTTEPNRLGVAANFHAAPVSVSARLAGLGRGPHVLLINVESQRNATQNVRVQQMFPRTLLAYFHTLNVSVDDAQVDFWPSRLRVSAVLPPLKSLTVAIEVHPRTLSAAEYRPDAHRGFDLPSAEVVAVVAVAVANRGDDKRVTRVYGDPLVIPAALPDFSLPYNTIALSSTVLAVALGALYKAATRMHLPLPPA